MHYYFLADYPAIIKIDGIYHGRIDKGVKPVTATNCPFIEVCSLSNQGESANFILDQGAFTQNLQNVSIIDLSGGYFIRFIKTYRAGDFSVLLQERFPNALLTVFCDNGYKLSLENANGFYAENLDFNAQPCKAYRIEGLPLVAVHYQSENVLSIFDIKNQPKKIFERVVDEFNFDKTIKIIERYFDMKKHLVESEWDYSDGELKAVKRTVTAQGFSMSCLPEKLTPYAFLEELLVGGDINEYLGEKMINHSHRIGEYLGEFIGVTPPPVFKDAELIGIIKKQEKNRYKLEYLSFDLERGKIVNIKKQ